MRKKYMNYRNFLKKFAFFIITILSVFSLTYLYGVNILIYVLDDSSQPQLTVEYSETAQNNITENLTTSQASRQVILQRKVYPADPACKSFVKCLYKDGTFPQIPLVSFPGSGNTWTRHLLELASGIYTGSIYKDVELLSRGFVGEKEAYDAGSTIVQKMHLHFSKELNVSRAILLIRNPYKAIVSFVQYMESGHLGRASLTTFRKKEWYLYMLRKTYEWISIAKSWIEAPVDLIIIYYENLYNSETLISELAKVCNFLEIKCHNLNTTCFINHKEGLFHRTNKFVSIQQFPEWVTTRIDAGIEYLNSSLSHNGYNHLPAYK